MRSILSQAHAYGAAHSLHSAHIRFGEALYRVRSVTVPIKDVRFGQRSVQNLTGSSQPKTGRPLDCIRKWRKLGRLPQVGFAFVQGRKRARVTPALQQNGQFCCIENC